MPRSSFDSKVIGLESFKSIRVRQIGLKRCSSWQMDTGSNTGDVSKGANQT